jgi:hypothetical protein
MTYLDARFSAVIISDEIPASVSAAAQAVNERMKTAEWRTCFAPLRGELRRIASV